MSGGGISLPAYSAAAISGAGTLVVYASSAAEQANQANTQAGAQGLISGLATPFRPPQWSVGLPAMTMLTIPAQYVQSNASQVAAPIYDANGKQTSAAISSAPPNATPIYLVFDGVMRISHSQRMIPTEHPVQDSANLSDHIRATNARVTMDVLMTDVLPAYASGQWTGNSSKSVACFQTLDNLRLNRIPLIVTTRLKTYSPMFIMNVTPDESVKTRYGFRGRIEFEQLFLFSVASQTVSARQQTTDETTLGQTNPTPVPTGVQTQNGLPARFYSTLPTGASYAPGTVIGSGNYSSNPVGGLLYFPQLAPGGQIYP